LTEDLIFQEAHGDGSAYNYHPHPVDMTNLTLSREMQNMAERLAENAHDIWAKKKMEELQACGGEFSLFQSNFKSIVISDLQEASTHSWCLMTFSLTRRRRRTEKGLKSS
jgi:RyR domain